jgi:hypothetical protein
MLDALRHSRSHTIVGQSTNSRSVLATHAASVSALWFDQQTGILSITNKQYIAL